MEAGADPTLKEGRGKVPKDYFGIGYSDFNDNVNYREALQAYEKWEKIHHSKKERIEKEMRQKFPLEDRLRQNIVGQDEPINMIASIIRCRENG